MLAVESGHKYYNFKCHIFDVLGSLKTVVRGLEKEGGMQVRWNKGVCREVNGNYLRTGFLLYM